MGVTFQTIPSDFDEKLDDTRSPETVARELALGKAMAVAKQHPDSIVIGSDTIVTIDGAQLEKPRDTKEAHDMLRRLAGKPNEVSTGVAVVCVADNIQLLGVDTTKVFFRPYDQEAVKQYIATGDPMDKAGSYGIQSGAATLIDHIEGHYDTVVGLPTRVMQTLLSEIDIDSTVVEVEPPVPQRFKD